MSQSATNAIGIGCFVVAAVLLFVAWERYQENARNVEAANQMLSSSPLGGMIQGMTGATKAEPATPTATKYTIVFAIVAAGAGIACFVVGGKKPQPGAPN
jgi:hypothetical protein